MIPLQELTKTFEIDKIIASCRSKQIKPKVLIRQLRFNPRSMTEQEWGSWELDRKNFPGFLHYAGYSKLIRPIAKKVLETLMTKVIVFKQKSYKDIDIQKLFVT